MVLTNVFGIYATIRATAAALRDPRATSSSRAASPAAAR